MMSEGNIKTVQTNRLSNVLARSSWSEAPDNENEGEASCLYSDINDRNIQEESFEQFASHPSRFMQNKMRKRLRFFFMNPVEKWQAKRRFPYKLLIQVIKIILVTVQLCLFAHTNYIHVNYAWDNKIAFSHLFLQGWDASQEVPAFPPSTGPLALYKQDEFYETVDYALAGYYNLSNAIGSYSYTAEDNSVGIVVLCLYHYEEGIIFGFNESYIFNSKVDKICLNITKEDHQTLTSNRLLQQNYIQVNFSSLIKAELKFALKTVNLKAAGPIAPPDCYKFKIKILFDNKDFDGQMLLSLDAEPMRLICKGDTRYITNNQIESGLRTMLNVLVVFICSFSLVLCSRAIYRAQLLKFETMNFFKRMYGKSLSLEGRLEFLNLWYVMIIINDLLIITGSVLKQQIETKQYGSEHWSVCSIFLGTGNLLVWFGLLRYLGFFKTYNVVILTLKKAAPKVARFLICAILIYAGFTFCGWLILGPYHIKFRSLATTSECLFALINGDDLFGTFSMTQFHSPILWWYSRLYLYSFICLYTYVILSLFISIIMDAYDTIKLYYRDGFPKSDLQTFVSACTDEASSGAFIDDADNDGIFSDFLAKICCCRCKKPTYNSFTKTSSTSSGESVQV